MTSQVNGFPQCMECFLHHNPENDDCGFYEDYCNERYTIESKSSGNYYTVTLADGSKIYVFNGEFCCSHCSSPDDEIGDACEKCTKHLWEHIEPIDESFWKMYNTMKMIKEKEYN